MNFIYTVILTLSTFFIRSTIAYTYHSEVGMYYKVHNEKVAWDEAVKICESEGGSLSMPRNKEEVNILLRLISHPYILIGFHSLFTVNQFITINGEDLQYYYNIWDANQPNEGVGMCGYLSTTGKIHDGQCKQKFPFVCEKKTSSRKEIMSDPNCKTKDTEYRYAPEIEKCYKIHVNPQIFITAETICIAEGGHLAIIRNKEEETFLSRLFKEPKYGGINAIHFNNVYVGVNEMLNLGTFKTVLNEPFNDIKYAHWDSRVPRVPSEHCVTMNKDGMLDDCTCETPGFFICEQPSLKGISTIISATQIASTNDYNTRRENININVNVNTMKSDCTEPIIDIRSAP